MSEANLIARACRRGLAIGALLLATLSTAQAAFVVAEWDPPFGSPFANLGWRGSMTAFVPESCTGIFGSGIITGLGDCPDLAVTAASVEFYDIGTGPTLPTVETLDFEATTQMAWVVKNEAGEIQGWTTYFTGAVQSSTPLAELSGGVDPYFALQLYFPLIGADPSTKTEAILWWSDSDPNACIQKNIVGANVFPTGFLWWKGCFDGRNNSEGDPALRAVVEEFRVVPEPGSLALVGAALTLLGLGVRPRRPVGR